MDDNLDFEEVLAELPNNEAILETMLDSCKHLVGLAHQSSESSLEEVHEILEEFTENGYGVFSIYSHDTVIDTIETDRKAKKLLNLAIERRKEEGYIINASHTVISTCGHVFIINTDDLSQCTVVRHVA